jgi:putative membrane protein
MAEREAAWHALLRAWSLEPSVLLGLALLGCWYACQALEARHFAPAPRPALFAAGLAVLLVALASPLDRLADRYLFSAHMTQHLLLAEAAPPLLLLGLSPTMAWRLLRRRVLARAERLLAGNALVSLVLYVGALTVWHVPTLYEATLVNTPLHVAEHLTYLGAGIVFWWPVTHPGLASAAMTPPARILYLFAACLPNTALGAVLTFAPIPLYSIYANTADPLGPDGLFSLTRGAWGLSPLVDQQLGGLLMWVPGAVVYVAGVAGTFGRWYAASATDESCSVSERQ